MYLYVYVTFPPLIVNESFIFTILLMSRIPYTFVPHLIKNKYKLLCSVCLD